MIGPVMMRGMRPMAAVLAAIVLTFACEVPARAQSPAPTPTPSSTVQTLTRMAVLNKSAWTASVKLYKAALANRVITTTAINATFTKVVKRAKRDLGLALAKATTPAQKSAANARFRDAIDKATALRQASLDSLPELPPAPGPRPSTK